MSGLTVPQVRQAIDGLCLLFLEQGNQLTWDQKQTLSDITQHWQKLRHSIHPDYWPIIEDRLSLLTS